MFANSANTFVADALRGLIASTDDIAWQPDPGFLSRRDRIPQGRVALLSGGGSGHEPMHAGFIGEGMLTAVCPGLVFTSPNALQVHEASKAISAGGGVLHIVKNYTGDVMNFHIARELLHEDGIETDFVLVDDDVATERSDGDGPGRRGTAATVVVEKVCGAAAQRGDSLDAVAVLGRRVASNSRSMAVALGPCTLPGSASPSFDLPEDEIELGIGIHGERGTSRVPTISARDIVAELAGAVVASLALERGDTVLAFVNGLGGTHPLELHLLFGELAEYLSDKGITIARTLVGSFVTALNMAGASITLVCVDEEILQLWDAPTSAPGWPNAAQSEYRGVGERGSFGPSFTPSVTSSDTSVFVGKWISSWVRRVLDEEPALTDLDRKAGDGDFGTNMVAALHRLDLDSIREELPAATVFEAVSEAYLGHAGGTSGALFGLWFRQFYRELGETVDLDAIVRAARNGLDSITELGGAQVGDKTMVDALAPAVAALEEAALEEATSLVAGLHAAAEAAKEGASSTSELTANRGRASYVGEAARGVTDPGALVMAWYFEAASDAAESVLAQ